VDGLLKGIPVAHVAELLEFAVFDGAPTIPSRLRESFPESLQASEIGDNNPLTGMPLNSPPVFQ